MKAEKGLNISGLVKVFSGLSIEWLGSLNISQARGKLSIELQCTPPTHITFFVPYYPIKSTNIDLKFYDPIFIINKT